MPFFLVWNSYQKVHAATLFGKAVKEDSSEARRCLLEGESGQSFLNILFTVPIRTESTIYYKSHTIVYLRRTETICLISIEGHGMTNTSFTSLIVLAHQYVVAAVVKGISWHSHTSEKKAASSQ